VVGVLTVLLLAAAQTVETTPSEDTALSAKELRDRAEEYFRGGILLVPDEPDDARRQFAHAARLYALLGARGYQSPALCRNQANAYFLAGDLPHAILTYRQGLRLWPADHNLRRNLEYARQEVVHAAPGGFGRPPLDHRPPWLPRLPAWSPALAVLFYTLGCLAAARWWMYRTGTWLAVSGASFAAAAVLGGALAYEHWDDERDRRSPIVVIADDGVLLYRGNGRLYPTHPVPLNRGVEARLKHDAGNWLQIELSGGEVGWVRRPYALVNGANTSASSAGLDAGPVR
jgi:tetratricopeptide (TPR) repeat protein